MSIVKKMAQSDSGAGSALSNTQVGNFHINHQEMAQSDSGVGSALSNTHVDNFTAVDGNVPHGAEHTPPLCTPETEIEEHDTALSLDRLVSDLTHSQPPVTAERFENRAKSVDTGITTENINAQPDSQQICRSTLSDRDVTCSYSEVVARSNNIPDEERDTPIIERSKVQQHSKHTSSPAAVNGALNDREVTPFSSVETSSASVIPSRSEDILREGRVVPNRKRYLFQEENLNAQRNTEQNSSTAWNDKKVSSSTSMETPLSSEIVEKSAETHHHERKDNICFVFPNDPLSGGSNISTKFDPEERDPERPTARFQVIRMQSLSSEISNYNLTESDDPPPYTEISDISVQSRSKSRFHDQKMYIEESQNNRISGHSRPDKTVVMRLLNEDFELIIPPCTEELFAMSVKKAEDLIVPRFLSPTKATIVQLLCLKNEHRLFKLKYHDENLWNEYFCRWSEDGNDVWNKIGKNNIINVQRTSSSVDIQTFSPGRYLVIQRKIPMSLRPLIKSQYHHPYLSIEISMCHTRSPLFRGCDNEDDIVSFFGEGRNPFKIEMEIVIDLFDQEEWVIRDTVIACRVSKNVMSTKPYQGYDEPVPEKPVAVLKVKRVKEIDGSFECSFLFRSAQKNKTGDKNGVTIPHKVNLSNWRSDSSYIN